MNNDPDDITRCPHCFKFLHEKRLLWHLDHECMEIKAKTEPSVRKNEDQEMALQ